MHRALIAIAASTPGSAVSPVASATNDILSYILSYGVLGVVALAFAFRYIVPKGAVNQARDEARADLLEERDRLIDEKRQIEEQRDEALRIANQQIVPLLVSFTAATQSLLPLLQNLVQRETGRQTGRRDDG